MKKRLPKAKLSGVYAVLAVFIVGFLYILIVYPWQLRKQNEREIAREEAKSLVLSQQQKSVLTRVRAQGEIYLPILLYHYVEIVTDERDTIREGLSITPQVFESQLVTLVNNGFTPITFDDLSAYYAGRAELPNKPIIITFDDGYRDFYTDVFPLLKKHQIRAAIFVVSGFLDYTKNYLTRAQLKEIAASPLVEINAHSVNHPNLTLLSLPNAVWEITESKRALENFLGRPVNHFAYPFGAYSQALAYEVTRAGFHTAATVEFGVNQSFTHRFTLKRIRVGGFTGAEFLAKLKPEFY